MTYLQNKQENENIRAFIAITLPEKVISNLKGLQAHLKTCKIKGSWPKALNMHITLKFFGNIPVSKIQDIDNCMQETTFEFKKKYKTILLNSERIGVFPSVKNPLIIWAGIKGQINRLEFMYSILNRHLKKAGFKKEKKRFSPHITICRLKQSVSEKRMTGILKTNFSYKSDAFSVNSITLFKSRLLPTGAVHTKVLSKKI